MQTATIIRRLEVLEKRFGGTLPEVITEYRNGETVTYKGLPPMEHIFRLENPIIKTWGSDFADLVNDTIHPLPNRDIEDYEE